MKHLTTLLLTLLLLGGCSQEEGTPESIDELTNKLVQFKSELTECDSLESCEKVSTDMMSYMIEVNHPENDGQLCNEYAECYEASVDLTHNGLSEEYINKLATLMDKRLFPDD